MKKFYPYVMALTLVAGAAIYGSAQTAYSGRQAANAFLDDRDHDRFWEEGRKQAQEMGYQDGLNDGLGDFNNHHSFRPTHDNNYKHGDRGYDDRFGDKGRYVHEYREAYERGYREGYYKRGGEHEHGHDHDHDYSTY